MMYQRLLSFVLTLLLVISLSAPALASEVETESGATIQLTQTTGDVAVTKSSEKPVSVREGMRLYNGYTITTGAESYAWINLDSSKLIKLDASSSAEIRKNGKLLEVNVKSGSAFFDVSKKLDDSENLNVRTATMAVGIRGTCGWANVESQLVSAVHLLEGACECAVSDPATGQAVTGELHDGETASCVVNPDASSDAKCDILISDVNTADIPGFVLLDVVQDISLCDTILENSGLDILADLAAAAGGSSSGRSADGLSASLEVLGLAEQKVRDAEQANAARLQQMQNAEAQQVSYIARDNVWTSVGSAAALDSGAASRTGATATPASTPTRSAGTIAPAEYTGLAPNSAPAAPTAADTAAPEQTSAPTSASTSNQPSTQTPQPSAAAPSPSTTAAASTPVPSSVQAPQLSSAPTSAPSAAQTSQPSAAQTPEPSAAPTSLPSVTPTPLPSATQTPQSSSAPTTQPSATQTPGSSTTLTPQPSSTQRPEPIPTPTLEPIRTPLPEPILTPVPEPTPVLTPEPAATLTPGPIPTLRPEPIPTLMPEPVPTPPPVPTVVPTLPAPTPVLTSQPTPTPSPEPTPVLTPEPTATPTPEPSPTYTIMFDANGGTVTGNATAETNTEGFLSTLPTATMASGGVCEFDGWYTAKTGGSQVTTGTRFTSNTTVYAHWKGWTLSGTTVTILGEGAMEDYGTTGGAWVRENIEHAVIESGVTSIGRGAFHGCSRLKSVSIPGTVTSIEDHAFADCSSLTSIVIPDSVSSIGYNAFSGCSSLTSISIPGSTVSIGSNAFTGCPAGLVVTYGGTTAQWNAIAGLSASGLTGKTVQCTDGTLTSARRMSRRMWTAYAVALDAAGGSVETDVCWTDADGKLTELPEPTWEDHVFDGWYTSDQDGDRVTMDTVFDEDTTIFAHWTKVETADDSTAPAAAVIRLEGCGGSLAVTSLRTDENGMLTELPKPARDGYVFEGWYTARTGGRRIVAGSIFTEDAVIYARWTADAPDPSASPQAHFLIRFDACGGTVSPESMKTDDNGTLSSLPTPDWKNHTFVGWYTAETGGTKAAASTVFTKNTTLYAHWKDSAQSSAASVPDEDVFTIRLDACGGTVKTASLKTDADGKVSALPTPERESYTFQGWYTDPESGTKVSTKTVFEKNTKLYAHWAEAEPAPSADATASASPEGTDSQAEAGSGAEDDGDDGSSTQGSAERD